MSGYTSKRKNNSSQTAQSVAASRNASDTSLSLPCRPFRPVTPLRSYASVLTSSIKASSPVAGTRHGAVERKCNHCGIDIAAVMYGNNCPVCHPKQPQAHVHVFRNNKKRRHTGSPKIMVKPKPSERIAKLVKEQRERRNGNLAAAAQDLPIFAKPRVIRRAKKQDLYSKASKTPPMPQKLTGSCPLLAMPVDVFSRIAGYLEWRDLNEFACVSKRCQEERSKPSYDTTREAVLVIRPPRHTKGVWSRRQWTHDQLQFFFGTWQNSLSKYPHYTRMVLQGVQHIRMTEAGGGGGTSDHQVPMPRKFIDHVKTLKILRSAPSSSSVECDPLTFRFCVRLFPHVQDLHMDDIFLEQKIEARWENLPSLRLLSYTRGTCDAISLDVAGRALEENGRLQELYIDGATFGPADDNRFLHKARMSLVKTSCVNVEVRRVNSVFVSPVSQEQLMTFVREAPNLRWFRSDLSVENIHILEKERPEVVFEASPLQRMLSDTIAALSSQTLE